MTRLEPPPIPPGEVPTREGPAPAEVLFPEARQRRHRRLLRRATVVMAAALVVALVVTVVVRVTGGGSSQGASNRATPAGSGAPGPVTVRQVLCYAPAYTPSAVAPGTLPASCPSAYQPPLSNGLLLPGATTGPDNTHTCLGNCFQPGVVAADPGLARFPTTTRAELRPSATALLKAPTYGGSPVPDLAPGHERLLLGPSLQVLSRATIASAQATLVDSGEVVVNYRYRGAAGRQWNRIAQTYYRHTLAFVVGNKVVTAAAIDATNFGGHGELVISPRSEANWLASAMLRKS